MNYNSGILYHLGKNIYRYRKSIIFIWILLIVSMSFFAIKLPNQLHGSGFETKGTYADVNKIMENDFNFPKSSIIVLFEAKKDFADNKEYQSFVENQLNAFEKLEQLKSISSPYELPNMIKNNMAYAVLSFDIDDSDMKSTINDIRNNIINSNEVSISLTGTSIISEDMNQASQKDLAKSEMIGLPFAIIILILAFGSLIASGIPLIIGISSVVSSMGVLYFLGLNTNLSIFLLNIVPMIGIALGIDFALLLVNRFKEEIKNKNIEDALIISTVTAGHSIIFSGLCVFLGLSAMIFVDIDIFKTVAIGGMTVVFLSVLSAITFLPALLSVIGHNINKWSLFKSNDNKQNKWLSFSKFVMKRPIIMIIISSIVLIVGLLPVKNIELTIPTDDALPSSYESRIALNKYNSTFNSEKLSPTIVVYESENDILNEDSLNEMYKLIENIKENKIVKNVESIFTYAGDINATEFYSAISSKEGKETLNPILDRMSVENKSYFNIYLNVSSSSDEAKDFIRELNKDSEKLNIKIGGQTKMNQEIFDEIFAKIPYGLLFVLISTYIILLFAFRSIIIPLKAIIMNTLSLGCTFGLLVWLFQGGHFGIEQTSIGLIIPVLVFGLVFGLSMDYEVFLISKMQEIYKETKDNDKATIEGLASTSKIITSAALIMIIVTGSFAFTEIVPIKQIGIGIALAIFIDATIIRMILVPSLMKLMGDWNWWYPKRK